MDIDQLQTFNAILEEGSFSKAAQSLRIAQSTVSFHIKSLEDSVGARLLDRTGGKVKPTEAGLTLKRYATRILALHSDAVGRLKATVAGEVGRLTIAASSVPADYILPSVLTRFLDQHPKVALRVDVSDSRLAITSLLEDGCDLAVVGAPIRDKRLYFTPFAEDEVLLVGKAGDPLAGKRLDETDLLGVRLIVREEGSGTREAVEALLSRREEAPLQMPLIQIGSTEAAKRCVLAGGGLALLSKRAVEEELKSGKMVAMKVQGLPVRRRFYVARQRTATPSAAAQAFWDELVGKGRGSRK